MSVVVFMKSRKQMAFHYSNSTTEHGSSAVGFLTCNNGIWISNIQEFKIETLAVETRARNTCEITVRKNIMK